MGDQSIVANGSSTGSSKVKQTYRKQVTIGFKDLVQTPNWQSLQEAINRRRQDGNLRV